MAFQNTMFAENYEMGTGEVYEREDLGVARRWGGRKFEELGVSTGR